MRHSLPTALPVEWLSSARCKETEGSYRTWIVLRDLGGVEPYAIHLAYWNDDTQCWGYATGDYYADETKAIKRWAERTYPWGSALI